MLAIVLILAGIIVPKYSFMKDSAKITEVKHGLTRFYRNQQTFYIENGYYGLSDEIGFKFESKNYRVGFSNSFKGSGGGQIESTCVLSTNQDTFKAGSANNNNKLINLTINEQNCLKKITEGSSDCDQTVGDCISN